MNRTGLNNFLIVIQQGIGSHIIIFNTAPIDNRYRAITALKCLQQGYHKSIG